MVEIKGLHKVKAKGRTYWYAWRGGPPVPDPDSAGFMAAYNKAIEDRRAPDSKRFRSAVVRYKASPAFQSLADSTKRNWSPWLDRISDHFGGLRIAQFDRAKEIRKRIRLWRSQYAETPRTADFGMQVLSRVCSFLVDPLGEIEANPCEGIAHLYRGDRSDIIWTDDDIAELKQTCSVEIGWAVDLAAHTGLRASDLVRLSWSHVGEDAIIMKTGKRSGRSKKQREALIPLYQACHADGCSARSNGDRKI